MRRVIDRLEPTSVDLTNVVCVLLLTGLALHGFATSYGGVQYLVVGLAGALLGALVAFAATRLMSTWLVGLATAVAIFVAAGGPLATRGEAIGGVIPTPAALQELWDGLIHGWAQLLTTLPPAGSAGGLLAVPYLSGYVCALVATLLALRVWRWPFAALPAVVLLALTILLGTDHPASLVVEGAAFLILLIGWTAWRAQVVRGSVAPWLRHSGTRIVGMLAVAAALGWLLAPALPFASNDDRYTLRAHVDPPVDLSDVASPLAGFRQFSVISAKAPQFTVGGLPAGSRIRLAVMDSYDGVVWNLAQGGGSGVFQRVGSEIPTTVTGPSAAVHVRLDQLQGPWLPVAGAVTGLTFAGDAAKAEAEGLRVNLTTATAFEQSLDTAGESYTFRTVLPATPNAVAMQHATIDSSVSLPAVQPLSPDTQALLAKQVANATGPYGQLVALQKFFHDNGYYSDGGLGTRAAPGHSLLRMASFLAQPPDSLVGNAEQYSAAMALAARSLGIPARVVMGFRPKGPGTATVTGANVDAWVEVPFSKIGWVAFDPTPDHSRVPQPETHPQPREQTIRPQVPPLIPPKAATADQAGGADAANHKAPKKKAAGSGGGVVGLVLTVVGISALVLLVLASPGLLVLVLKARRRRRRRGSGRPDQRISAGWHELLDRARDLGIAPGTGTRRQQAEALPPVAYPLVGLADAATFAADPPSDEDAHTFWQHVSTAIHELHLPLTRRQRWRAALNLSSLRAAR